MQKDVQMNSRHPSDIVGHYGFTLVELLVTLAVLGIVATLAIPAFTNMSENIRNKAIGRELFSSINLARTIAVSRQKHVVLCASSDAASCNQRNNFSYGGIIFLDENKDGSRTADEQVLQTIPAAPENSSLFLRGGLFPHLRYKPDGTLTSGGHFRYCPRNGEASDGWIIVYYWSGRPYFGRDGNGDGIAENGQGDNLSC
ncbi:GspH/FimT family pseudopilin [Microbulbifer sp. SA54]|uniref:GspH/FimT family pseudopilin n=1 Tax=Microbulbifer sp. SA54 TaxID=3401577 RepID=UPI003AB0ADAC